MPARHQPERHARTERIADDHIAATDPRSDRREIRRPVCSDRSAAAMTGQRDPVAVDRDVIPAGWIAREAMEQDTAHPQTVHAARGAGEPRGEAVSVSIAAVA
jgi:hypothetical protein